MCSKVKCEWHQPKQLLQSLQAQFWIGRLYRAINSLLEPDCSLSLSEAETLDLPLFITRHLSHKRGDSCIPGLNNWVTRFLCVSGSALPTPPLPPASAPLFLFCGALWAGRASVIGEAGGKVKPGNGTLCLRMQSKVIAELEMESQNSDSKLGTERT